MFFFSDTTVNFCAFSLNVFSLGHREPLLGTVMLTLCREKQLFPLAEEIIAKLIEKKMIKSKFDDEGRNLSEHF